MTSQNTPTLTAKTREVVGTNLKTLRSEGIIPAVAYGNKKDSVSLALNQREFEAVYKEAGSSALISLTIDGSKGVKVLVHEVQLSPTRQEILHVDFYQVNLKEKLHTAIPLEFIGEAPAVEAEGGSLSILKDEIEVECLPDDLVQHIDVDISQLITFEDVIRISDLIVPSTITVLHESEDLVASVMAPRSEEELEALDEAPVENVADVEAIHGDTPEEGAEGEEAKEEK